MRHDPEKNTQPKVRLLKVLLNFILSAAMVLGTIPCEPFLTTANAETEKTISGLEYGQMMDCPYQPDTYETSWYGSYVYYGKYDGKPVKYRVLSAMDYYMFLDCDNVLKTDKFDEEGSNTWANSSIRAWLQGEEFFENPEVFTPAEKSAIINQYPNDAESGRPDILGGFSRVGLERPDPVFLPDVGQVTKNEEDGYGYFEDLTDSKSRIKTDLDGKASSWWLRSNSTVSSDCAAVVDNKGRVTGVSVNSIQGVSPALAIKNASIIFSSLVEGEDGYAGSEYKFTIKDDNLSVSPSVVKKNNNKVTIAYTINDGSKSADPTQVSVLVTKDYTWNNDWGWDGRSYLQYTKLEMEEFGQSGTGTFTLDPSIEGTWGEDYHVYVLAEDVNDTYETDYASAPVEVEFNGSKTEASAEDVECIYDGKPHGIHVELNGLVDGATVKYGLSADKCTLDASPTITSAADSPKEIFYQVTRDGYLTASGSATVKIDKAKLVVSALEAEIKYGDPLTNKGVYYNGFVNSEDESVLGGKLEYDYTYTRYDAPGYYKVTPKGLTSDNYDIKFGTVNYSVECPNSPYITVYENAKYGHSGTVELKDHILPVGGFPMTESMQVSDPDSVLNGDITISENVLSYSFKDDPAKVGKKARAGFHVADSSGQTAYTLAVELKVTDGIEPIDPSNTEVDPREADLREELEGLGSDVPVKVDQKKDEDGNVVEETVTIGGREVSKVVTDPESGKETVVSKVWISGLEDSYTYTGAAIRPSFNVYDGLRKLTEKTDYTVSWKKNKDAGTGTATVKFKGNYKDSKSETVSFKIDPAVLGKDIIAHEIGVAAKSKGSVKVSPVLTWAGTGKSVSSKYFEITPSTVTGEGTTEATINVKNGQKNFTGTATVLVKAVGDKNKLLSSAKVKFDPKSYSYSGMPIEPKYSLSIGSKTLTEGTDYRRVGITGNTNPGTATVIFEAVSGNAAGYVGSKTATFKISGKKELKEGASFTFICPDSVPYAKGGAKPLVTVSDNDIHTILREGKDYTLSYSKNKSVTGGSKTAEVKVKGKGDYKGTVTLKYAIDRQSLSANGIVISAEDQFATKDKLKAPKITITDVDGKKLAANKDYTVGTPDTSDPANTDTKGIVSVTVTGKGAYETETLTVTYRYEDKTLNIGKAKIAKKIDDQPFTGNAVKLSKADLTGVLSANGRTLVPGSDFTVTGYTNNIKKGTAKVTVKGIGEFAGTKTLSFKIVQRSVDYSGAIKGGAKTAASLPGGF